MLKGPGVRRPKKFRDVARLCRFFNLDISDQQRVQQLETAGWPRKCPCGIGDCIEHDVSESQYYAYMVGARALKPGQPEDYLDSNVNRPVENKRTDPLPSSRPAHSATPPPIGIPNPSSPSFDFDPFDAAYMHQDAGRMAFGLINKDPVLDNLPVFDNLQAGDVPQAPNNLSGSMQSHNEESQPQANASEMFFENLEYEIPHRELVSMAIYYLQLEGRSLEHGI
ncbi:hypothetical protein DFH27DRAFT_611925 [Peziza echinospora]|nr:hypothetical protein DFH27DRAFT_611925 [Peziza echinospora]